MSKKDKLLSEAQKLLQRGQSDKAAALFKEALNLDSGDIRVRQRLAELYVKIHRHDDARKEFEQIGKYLAEDGFYLKAIAVYKQVERLFPNDVDVALTLARLNEQHGLVANALTEYKRAYDHYDHQLNYAEAIKVLDAMQRLDDKNQNLKLKYAEVLHQQGRLDEALEAFRNLGLLLAERRDDQSLLRLSGRITELYPDKTDFVCTVLEQKINKGGADQAASILQIMIKADPGRLNAWRLLVLAYRVMANNERLKIVCKHFISRFPNELLPRENLIRVMIAERDLEAALSSLQESEHLFITRNASGTLYELYLALSQLAPMDLRVLEGCARTCELVGKVDEAAAFAGKSSSLGNLAGKSDAMAAFNAGKPQLSVNDEDEEDSIWARVFQGYDLVNEDDSQPEVEVATETDAELVSDGDISEATDAVKGVAPPDDDFYEVEINLDDFASDDSAQPIYTDNWFETVSNIFDNIQTETGTVRFGEGVDQQDAQSRFDLGMAFHEMGLYDEAINSFRQAAEDLNQRTICLIMQGACLRDKGEPLLAEDALRALMAKPDISIENICAIKYELALTCTVLGKDDEAWQLLQEIRQMNPAFRDVSSRQDDVSENKTSGMFDFSDEELSGFDLL